jgi:hypothetical protein
MEHDLNTRLANHAVTCATTAKRCREEADMHTRNAKTSGHPQLAKADTMKASAKLDEAKIWDERAAKARAGIMLHDGRDPSYGLKYSSLINHASKEGRLEMVDQKKTPERDPQ